MRDIRIYRLAFTLFGCCLLLFMTACGTASSTTASSTSVVHATAIPTGTPGTTTSGGSTVPVPQTLTSCPAAGTARAGVFAHLALGNQANIVYTVTAGAIGSPIGTLYRYTVATGAKTVIVKLPNTLINEAQLSADGQWILLNVQNDVGETELQLVRMDGQGLQTLVCGSPTQGNMYNAQWSMNQRLIVFAVWGVPGKTSVDLLNVTTGALQVEVTHISSLALEPRTWLDSTRVYLVNQPTDQPLDALYMLDTSRGPNQNASSLQRMFDATSPNMGSGCWNFDSSYDGTQLFTSECSATRVAVSVSRQLGPSAIQVRPATGGASVKSIYTSQNFAVTNVRAISKSTLLYTIYTLGGDSSQDGLWKIGVNGQNQVRLTSSVGMLNQYSQYPWSNISRDGNDYVLQSTSGKNATLIYGSLSGGATVTIASVSILQGMQMAMVGWTTL